MRTKKCDLDSILEESWQKVFGDEKLGAQHLVIMPCNVMLNFDMSKFILSHIHSKKKVSLLGFRDDDRSISLNPNGYILAKDKGNLLNEVQSKGSVRI